MYRDIINCGLKLARTHNIMRLFGSSNLSVLESTIVNWRCAWQVKSNTTSYNDLLHNLKKNDLLHGINTGSVDNL